MEVVTEVEVSIVTEPDMGSEASQLDAIRQEERNTDRPDQFYKVLVEPEYSELDPLKLSSDTPKEKADEDVHSQATLRIGDKVEKEASVRDKSDSLDTEVQDTDVDYSLIEECKALITESADRVVARSFSREDKEKNKLNTEFDIKAVDAVVSEEVDSGVNSDENVIDNELQNEIDNIQKGKELNEEAVTEIIEVFDEKKRETVEEVENEPMPTSGKVVKGRKSKSKSKKSLQKLKEREIIDSVQGALKGQNSVKDKKGGKGNGILSMFKFSKRKQKEVVSECVVEDQITDDIKESNDAVVFNENAIKSVTENDNSISVNINDSVLEVLRNAKPMDVSQSQDAVQTEEKATSSTVSHSNTPLDGEYENTRDVNGSIKRLNSLDSGIVVEKVSEQQIETTEYSVVHKQSNKDDTHISLTDNKTVDGPNEPKRNTNGDLYMNGDKTDEDFVFINERAIDVDGIVGQMENATFGQKLQGGVVLSGDLELLKVKTEEIIKDNTANTEMSETTSEVKTDDEITRPENAKLKKKSWSFQFGGNKKKQRSHEAEETVSLEPNASQRETKTKKKKSFGKFSFRKQNTEVSASTPNLNTPVIPEEIESQNKASAKNDDNKKATKLKKIKAKKEKKRRDSQTKEGEKLEKKSTSLLDLILGDANAPRSRRSIVEEDREFKESDAFDGVSLSDLSIDGDDVHVSHNPAGSDSPIDQDSIQKPKTPLTHEMKTTQSQSKLSEAVGDTRVEYAQVVKTTARVVKEKLTTFKRAEPEQSTDLGDEYAQINKTTRVNAVNETVKVPKVSRIIAQAEVIDAAKIAQLTQVAARESEEMETYLNVSNIVGSQKSEVDQVLQGETKYTPDSDDQGEDQQAPTTYPAYSNNVYSDDTFQATVDDIAKSKEDSENQEDDSDAYVHLEQLVKDVNVDNFTTPTYSNISEVKEHAETKMTNFTSETVETDTETKDDIFKPKVIIMKDVGIQAPDIYMPLDVERDFGYIKNNVSYVSVGIQVTDNASETESTVNQGETIEHDVITMAAAYF